jgi:hypothetical protein
MAVFNRIWGDICKSAAAAWSSNMASEPNRGIKRQAPTILARLVARFMAFRMEPASLVMADATKLKDICPRSGF